MLQAEMILIGRYSRGGKPVEANCVRPSSSIPRGWYSGYRQIDNSKLCGLRLSTSNIHTFKFIHRFSQATLHYTMISCNNTVNRKGADSKTWKLIEKYIKRYDDKVTFYKLGYIPFKRRNPPIEDKGFTIPLKNSWHKRVPLKNSCQ
jgi:hypothetical protein